MQRAYLRVISFRFLCLLFKENISFPFYVLDIGQRDMQVL